MERNQLNLNRNITTVPTLNISIKFLSKRTLNIKKTHNFFFIRLEEILLLLEKVLKPTLEFSFTHYIYTCLQFTLRNEFKCISYTFFHFHSESYIIKSF